MHRSIACGDNHSFIQLMGLSSFCASTELFSRSWHLSGNKAGWGPCSTAVWRIRWGLEGDRGVGVEWTGACFRKEGLLSSLYRAQNRMNSERGASCTVDPSTEMCSALTFLDKYPLDFSWSKWWNCFSSTRPLFLFILPISFCTTSTPYSKATGSSLDFWRFCSINWSGSVLPSEKIGFHFLCLIAHVRLISNIQNFISCSYSLCLCWFLF